MKCVNCEYYGRMADAPETVEKDCVWQLSEDENDRPCEKLEGSSKPIP